MSNNSLPARGTDPPFSHKSVVSITHQRNVICNITLICRQLFAGQVVTFRPTKRKEKNTSNGFSVHSTKHIYDSILQGDEIRAYALKSVSIHSLKYGVSCFKTVSYYHIPSRRVFVASASKVRKVTISGRLRSERL